MRHTSDVKVELVLGFEDLDVQFAVWSIVLEGPCTHDRVLILGGRGRGRKREMKGGKRGIEEEGGEEGE